MTNCIFYSLFFTLFLNLSFGSLRFSQVNRVFASIYKGMLEASVLTINNNGEPVVPYYNKERLGVYVDTYLKENISKYTTKYTVNTEYFNQNGVPTTGDYCRTVSINLKAKINIFFDYDKTQTFVVKSGETL